MEKRCVLQYKEMFHYHPSIKQAAWACFVILAIKLEINSHLIGTFRNLARAAFLPVFRLQYLVKALCY